MIVDTSALIRIVLRESGWLQVVDRLAAAPTAAISSANLLEVFIVLHGRGHDTEAEQVFDLLETFTIEIIPVSVEHVLHARTAFRHYGKGRHSRAKLNFGDCFAYALAKATGEPLLFVGDDFTHTDVVPALPS